MKSKFKIGDMVCGISDEYGVTNTLMKRGIVTEITEDGFISIKVIKNVKGQFIVI